MSLSFHLRNSVTRVEEIGLRLADKPPIKEVKPSVARTAKDFSIRFSAGGSIPPSEDIQILTKRLIQSVENQDFTEISKKDWKKAAWCLWNKETPLASNERFLSAYTDKLRSWHRRSSYGALIKAYLRDFDPDDPTFSVVAREIRSVVDQFDWPWSERHKLFKLFDEKEAPRKIAEACLTQAPCVEDGLSEIGLTGELSYGGLSKAGYLSALSSLKLFTDNPNTLGVVINRLFDWSVDGDELRFSGIKAKLADALLLPWSTSPPPDGQKKIIQVFLVRHLKDPRIHQSDWVGVSDDARNVMLRWLTEFALEQFLEIVDHIAKPEHWKFRRAFWTAYLDAGYVDEAWVAFGKDGARASRISFEKTGGFGRLETGYKTVESSHAALIMKLGGLIIADWSHNGKCEIWLPDNPHAPRLYKSRYDSDEIMERSDNNGVVHSSPATGSWQRKVAEYIRLHTGISMPMINFMPKRSY